MCCSVLQRVAACCNVLQCVAACFCNVCDVVLEDEVDQLAQQVIFIVRCCVLQRVAVRSSALHCVSAMSVTLCA